MSNGTKFLLGCLIIFASIGRSYSQFGIGLTFSNDLYNVYSNPEDGIADNKNGSAILNLAIGPKIWVGVEKFSISVESQVNYGALGLALEDYKGLGSVSFPFMAKLNFGGLSGLNKVMQFGGSLGGGIQYNKTEIYGLSEEFASQGVVRAYYKTYNVQAGLGLGISGFTGHFFARYGFNKDLEKASNFHVGFQFDFNLVQMKKIQKPESAL